MENNIPINNQDPNKNNIPTIVASITSLIFFIIGFIGVTIYSALSWGFVLFKFWNWFLIPSFQTIPTITYFNSFGLIMFITLFKSFSFNSQTININDTNNVNQFNDEFISFILPWLVLLIGLIIHGAQPLLSIL